MTLTELKKKLKEECLSRYLSKTELHYYNTPEFYSPLYRKFIDALVAGNEPEYYQENYSSLSLDKKNEIIKDIAYEEPGVIFDRYLLCLYPSRYEPSNPRKLNKSELSEKGILQYLQKMYLRPSTEHESSQLSREIDSILALLPKELRDEYKEKSKSACYKLFVLKYKLGLINHKWMDLIRYREFVESKKSSMDNIIDFNMISDENSKLNTALVKQFYFEINDGKIAGDRTLSFRVIQVPYYIRVLEEQIKEELFDGLLKGESILSLKDKILSRFDESEREINQSNLIGIYDDLDQKLMDQVQHTTLVNQYANKILAEKELNDVDNHQIFHFSYNTDWVFCDREYIRTESIIKEVGISREAFKKEWSNMAITLARVISHLNKTVADLRPTIQESLCTLAIALIKTDKNRNYNLKSKVSGSGGHKFSVYNDLKKFHLWVSENDPRLEDKHSISMLRPSSLCFFNLIYEELKYALLCSIERKKSCQNSFENMRDVHYRITHEICTKLRGLSHQQTIWIIESYYMKKRNESFSEGEPKLSLRFFDLEYGDFVGTIESHFIRTEWGSALESVSLRHQVFWNPINWMKYEASNSTPI
ncbi:hypothetical protein ACODG7_17500 [Vibrio anguillarum]|uniref:hypothetical protein n=1 Tax=Vibrio anguillarum TaxID=55601 RepID=UPI00031438D1|nr:hypothetical protein [Vibrio anguillarum]OEE34522.1 hypothetical protein A1QW_09500 [Vibrio anguillarum]OEF92627.1 hypothetical protein A1QY_17870 [Vibrio anguillarum]